MHDQLYAILAKLAEGAFWLLVASVVLMGIPMFGIQLINRRDTSSELDRKLEGILSEYKTTTLPIVCAAALGAIAVQFFVQNIHSPEHIRIQGFLALICWFAVMKRVVPPVTTQSESGTTNPDPASKL